MASPTAAERSARFDDLVALLQSVPKENFDPFQIHRAKYTSATRQIGTDILIPRSLSSGKAHPVIVRIHGGFLITGSSLFPAWFSKWILDFAIEQSAIIVSPDYRLLPEAKGVDILHDMQSFWKWFLAGGVKHHLTSVGKSDVAIDVNRLLLVGESAGGYLATQSVLSHFVRPKAMVLIYPMLDMQADHYTKEYSKPIVNVPNFPSSLVDDFLQAAATRSPITEADPPDRLAVALASVHTGRFLDFLGREPGLFVLERLRSGECRAARQGDSLLPPFFIIHGDGDSAVPVDGTHRFLTALREVDPTVKFHLKIEPGDHGFEAFTTLDERWLREGLDYVAAEWLAATSRLS